MASTSSVMGSKKKGGPRSLQASLSSFAAVASGAEAGLGLLDELGKRRLVEHGDVGQYLAVHGNGGFLQPVHEPAVAHAVLAGRRIDAGDPQRAELALAVAAVTVGILAG